MNKPLNTPISLQRDSVDELLKADAAAAHAEYIDDAGFTLRVIDALPKQAAYSNKLRFGLPLAGAVIAAVLVALFSPVSNFIIDASMDIMTHTYTDSAFALLAFMTALICIAVVGLQSDR